jgi:hypothetical protein
MVPLSVLGNGKAGPGRVVMVYTIARLLQVAGLILLPLAVLGEVAGRMTERDELTLAAVGILTFVVGTLLLNVTKK